MLTDWANEVLPLASAEANTTANMMLPTMPNKAMIITRRHLSIVWSLFAVVIDAIHRLSYPLAKRLEGIAGGNSIKRIDNKNGI